MRYDEFGTGSLAPHTQLEAWRSWYGNVFETSPLQPGKQGFVARNRAWNLGGLTLSHVSAPGITVSRTKTLIRREPVDHWAVTLSERRSTYLESGSGSLAAPAGVPFVLSLGQEMQNRRDEDERIQIYLSRDTFYSVSTLLDASCMTSIRMPGSRLLADYMRLLVRNVPNLSAADTPRLIDVTCALISTCLAPSLARSTEVRRIINVTLMERVRQTVRRHLHSSKLRADLICREAATSRSQLYRLLEGEGGVARYIQKLRLSEAFSILCQSHQTLTISALGESLCFSDASSFARAFRREFGVSPSDVREAAQAGLPRIPFADPVDEMAAKTFVSSLRS